MATSNTRYRPDWSSGGITAPNVGDVFLDFADRMAKQQDRDVQLAKQAEEQRRWDITNARADAEWNRKQQEQKAVDAYYDILRRGPQTRGGALNTEALISESNKYDFTPEEAKLFGTLQTPEQARAAGNEQLAKKIEWQQNLSNVVDTGYTDKSLQESRSQMFERAMGDLRGQGLPVLPGMHDKYDAAALAEKEAETKEEDILDKRIAELKKDELSLAKWAIGQQGGGGGTPVVDDEGNVTGYTQAGAKRALSVDDKYDKGVAAGEQAIIKAGNALTGENKAATTAEATEKYHAILKQYPNADPESVAAAVTGVLGSKKSWLDSIPLVGGPGQSTFKGTELERIIPSLTNTRTPEQLAGGVAGVGGSSKAQQARDLALLAGSSNQAELAALEAKKAALAKGSEGRQEDRVNAFLRGRDVLPSMAVSTEATGAGVTGATGKPLEAKVNKNIKSIAGIPDSMVASEGVTNTAYKDGNGYSVAMGYNLYYNKDDIAKDFEAANISPAKAFIAKTRPQDLVLDDGEAQRLSTVAYYKYADSLDKKLGGKLDTLSPQMQATALQMHYRGDLFGKADYSKELLKYVKTNNYDGLVKYVSDNAGSLPAPVVRRLENDLGAPVTEPIRGKASKSTETEPSKVKSLYSAVEDPSLNPATRDKGYVTPPSATDDFIKLLDMTNPRKPSETATGRQATPLSAIKLKSGDAMDESKAKEAASKIAKVYAGDKALNNLGFRGARYIAGIFGGNDLGGNTQYGSGRLSSRSSEAIGKLKRYYGIETQQDVQALINQVDPKDTDTIDALKHMQYYLRYDKDADFRKKEQFEEAATVFGSTAAQATGIGGTLAKVFKGRNASTIAKNEELLNKLGTRFANYDKRIENTQDAILKQKERYDILRGKSKLNKKDYEELNFIEAEQDRLKKLIQGYNKEKDAIFREAAVINKSTPLR